MSLSSFRLFDNQGTEEEFRFHYARDVIEKTARCWSGVATDSRCKNQCHFLVAEGCEHVNDEGGFPVFGIDCDVELFGWDNDVDDASIETYCRACAAAAHKFRCQQEREEMAASEKRREAERLELAEIDKTKRFQLDHWMTLSDLEFERQCAQLFKDLGYESNLTPRTNDGAIDVRLHIGGKRGAAQCKAWQQPCGAKVIREFYGAVRFEQMDFGYFISKSGFTKNAHDFLKKNGIVQGWDIHKLVEQAIKCAS